MNRDAGKSKNSFPYKPTWVLLLACDKDVHLLCAIEIARVTGCHGNDVIAHRKSNAVARAIGTVSRGKDLSATFSDGKATSLTSIRNPYNNMQAIEGRLFSENMAEGTSRQ